MAPKAKKKKKTKEELEEERRQAEEAARLAEEGECHRGFCFPVSRIAMLSGHSLRALTATTIAAISFPKKGCKQALNQIACMSSRLPITAERLRLEEEERQRLAELERQRQELLAQLTAQEDERIQGEMWVSCA
jgi:hypothetical protein